MVSTRQGLRISVAALAILNWVSVTFAASLYEGKPITDIQFDPGRQPLAIDQLKALLPTRVGQPLHAAELRDAIQRLYATGEYADIAADATLGSDGVTLKFLTKPAYFISNVRVTGVPDPPNQGQLAVATKLELGTEYSPDEMKRAADHLVDVLRRNGFYDVSIEPEAAFLEATQEVTIDFAIDPGKRGKYDGVIANGKSERPLESILKSTRFRRSCSHPNLTLCIVLCKTLPEFHRLFIKH